MIVSHARRDVPAWGCVLIAAATVAVAAAILLAMGRTPWCRCGSIKLWSSDAWGPENSQQFTDPYTFTHITHGVLLYFLLRLVARRQPLRVRFLLGVVVESAWEVFENTDLVINRYRAATLALGYYGDSVLNSIGDILACMVGFAIASGCSTRVAVVVIIVLELVLTLLIRDSLLLNIVMLIYPIEAVKHWQAGA